MIVGPRPLVPSRTDSSASEPSNPPPPGTGGDAFGRTLTDVLGSDRADRPTDRGRRRSEPDRDRGPATTARRDDRPEADDDRHNRRIGDGERAPTTKKAEEKDRTESDAGEDRKPVDAERPTGTDRRRSPDVDAEAVDGEAVDAEAVDAEAVDAEAVDERVVGTLQAVEVAVVAEFTASLDDPSVETAHEDGTAEQVAGTESAPTESAAAQPTAVTEPVTGETTIVDGSGGGPSVQSSGSIDGDGASNPTDSPISTPGAHNGGPAGVDGALGVDDNGQGVGQPIAPSPLGGRADIEPVESGQDETDSDPRSNTAAAEVTTVESSIAVAAAAAATEQGSTAVPDTKTANPAARSSATTEVSGIAGAGTLDQPVTAGLAGEADTATADPSASPGTTFAVDQTEETGHGGAESAEPPTGPGQERPPSGLFPAASQRAPAVAPTRTATTAVEGSGASPELVELQTTGLAERLRPAFAAVRRGVNGLDELRLRIQDDNAGPIKVDIATIDNRVRVLLSAGSDDLMRQLGQDRDRLADELRRAGFDQASIDIESNNPGRRRGHFEQEASGRSGSGKPGSGPSGPAASDTITRASSRDRRGLTGLDLDL